MSHLRKYGVGSGADVYLPVIKRASIDFAIGADWTPVAGDVEISIDGGAAANIATLPVAVAMGNTAQWKFVFSNAELQGKYISVTVADAATKAVEDQMFVIETFGHASALYTGDLNNLDASIAAVKAKTDNLPASPAAAGDAMALTSGERTTLAAAIWAALTSGLTTAGSIGKRIVDFVTTLVYAAPPSAAPTAAANAAAVWDELLTGATHNIANSAGKLLRSITPGVSEIIRTATCQAGSTSTTIKLDSGASATNQLYQWTVVSIISGTGAGQSRIVTAYVGSTKVATVDLAWIITPDNTSVYELTPTASVRLVSYAAGQDPVSLLLTDATPFAGASIAAIKAKTDNLPSSPAAVGSAMTLTSGERDSVAAALLDLANAIETGLTLRQAQRLQTAALAGKLSGAGTSTTTIRNAVADSKNRIVATTDPSGNRTAVTTDVS